MKYLSILAVSLTLQGAHVRTGEQQSADAVSIKNFGAKGDAITDDTAAIQSALNSACGDRFAISETTGPNVSPIVITTTEPHTFLNGSSVTIAGVKGNTNANGRWSATVLSPTTLALVSPTREPSNGNANYISGGTIMAAGASHLIFRPGRITSVHR